MKKKRWMKNGRSYSHGTRICSRRGKGGGEKDLLYNVFACIGKQKMISTYFEANKVDVSLIQKKDLFCEQRR